MWSGAELDLRARRYETIRKAWAANGPPDPDRHHREREQVLEELRPVLQSFLSGEPIGSLRAFVDSWSRGKPILGFGGPAGAMVLNQLANDGKPGEVDEVLRAAISLPGDLADATRKIDELASYVEALRAGGSSAAVGRVPFFASWFWSTQDEAWRPIWPNAESCFLQLAWLQAGSIQGDRYANFVGLVDALAERTTPLTTAAPAVEIEDVVSWFTAQKPALGIDETLLERCARAITFVRDPSDDPVLRASYEEGVTNIRVVLADLGRIAKLLQNLVADALRCELKVHTPTEYWVPNRARLRQDGWSSWIPQLEGATPALRFWVNEDAVYVVLDPDASRNRRGFGRRALKAVLDSALDDLTFYRWSLDDNRSRLVPTEPSDLEASFELGRAIPLADATDFTRLSGAVTAIVTALRPAFERIVTGASSDATSTEVVPTEGRGDLADLAARFRDDLPYPTDDDKRHQQARVDFAHMLDQTRLAALAREDLRRIAASKYGSPGPQSILYVTVGEADDEQWERLLATIEYLCWDTTDAFETRINRALDESDLGMRGFKEAVVMKLLAICHPDRFIPVYPFSGDKGKARMLTRLGLDVPALSATPGQRHVEANDSLRTRLDPLFSDDPWGQMQFLYWLLEQDEEPVVLGGVDPVEERVAEAADDLYLDHEFLDNIVSLLRDLGQVIFYGPPGTGKTHVALRLAEALTGDEDRWSLVQFHPSTSYEDFFEGYRPDSLPDGTLSYRLVPGPLRLIADDAAANPDHLHVLVIDEINRANLPKVLGELLFLLEYRNRAARPLYRPDEDFKLPKNLWIIGTMNTADRSIARLDAALRRRFHFVPFIPDVAGRNPISQVLERWVQANNELETLPEIVDAVNNKLRAALGGDHLLLGPSYFMRQGIDEQTLRRIWEFQVEPLIEDLFFGEPERVEPFRFERIWASYGAPALTDEPAGPE
jgi:5-methylcytosine-specific restriction protein B